MANTKLRQLVVFRNRAVPIFHIRPPRLTYFPYFSSRRLQIIGAGGAIRVQQVRCDVLVEAFELRIVFQNRGIAGGKHRVMGSSS